MPYGCFQISQGPSRQHGQAKVLLVPCRRLMLRDFFRFLGWDGRRMEKYGPKTKRQRCDDDDDHEISRSRFWHKTKWQRVDAILYKPTKSTTKQRMVFRTVHGFRILYQWAKLGLWTPKRLTPWPCESFSPKPSPATAVRWVPIRKTFLRRALLSKKSRHEVWMNLIIFHQPGIFPWFSARTPIFATKETSEMPNFRNLSPRRMTSPAGPLVTTRSSSSASSTCHKKSNGINSIEGFRLLTVNQGPFYYQPKQCTIVREILKITIDYVSFWSHQYGWFNDPL